MHYKQLVIYRFALNTEFKIHFFLESSRCSMVVVTVSPGDEERKN